MPAHGTARLDAPRAAGPRWLCFWPRLRCPLRDAHDHASESETRAADPGGSLVPGSEPRAAGCLTPGAGLAGRTRGRSAATEAAALGPRPAGRAPCRPWNHVLCPPCDGVSRHGAVACPALDPGPVQRCGWLRTPEAVSTAHPVSAALPLPWGGLAQVLGAGIRNTRSLGSMRGPNHRHQEGLLFEEAGQGRSRTLRV